MKRTIDLNSADWCEVVFEGKNKEYGAYAMRQTSGRRHILALGIITVAVAFLALLPNILDKVKASVGHNIGITTTVEIGTLKVEEETVKPIDLPKTELPPARDIRNSIKHTPPVITKDVDVDDENELKSMDKLLEDPKIAIGFVDRMDGTNNSDAELARDLLKMTATGTGGGGGDNGNTIFKHVEVMPQFPGGTSELYRYISDNLKYPPVDMEMGTQGQVVIQFVVGTAGEIKDAKILRGVSVNCDKEALRVVKNMPKWIPGRQNGNLVQVYFTLPIVYRLK